MCGMPPAGLIPKCPQPGPSFGTGRGKTLDAGARSPERGILGTQRDARTGGCGIIITLEIDVDDVLSLEFLTLSGLKPRDKDGAMIEITFVLPALHRGDDHPHALCGSSFISNISLTRSPGRTMDFSSSVGTGNDSGMPRFGRRQSQDASGR